MLSILSNARKKRLEGEEGFTLIELLVVVVILGILIAIAIPVYLNYKKSANDKAAQSDLRNALTTLETCSSDTGTYPTAVASTGAITGCGTSTITTMSLSTNTTLTYYPSTAASPTAYYITATNSGGTPKVYCYASAAGGSIKTISAAAAAYASSC